MTRFVLAGLLALPFFLTSTGTASAQLLTYASFFPRMHQHGPLYNYTPGYGACGYGCSSGSSRAPMSRGWYGGSSCRHGGGGLFAGGLFHRGTGCGSCGRGGWGHYAVSTFRNVFHRINPLASRCGQSCGVSCGSAGGCSSCGGAATAVAAPASPAPAAMPAKP